MWIKNKTKYHCLEKKDQGQTNSDPQARPGWGKRGTDTPRLTLWPHEEGRVTILSRIRATQPREAANQFQSFFGILGLSSD